MAGMFGRLKTIGPASQIPVQWRVGIGLACAALLLALLLVPLPHAWHGLVLLAVMEDLAHGPLFAFAACLALWLAAVDPTWRGYLAVWIAAAALAGGSEYVQGLGARDPSWLDVRTDIAGATFGLAVWGLLVDKRAVVSKRWRVAITFVAAVAGLWMMAPAFGPTADWVERERRFPMLYSGDFRSAIAMTESMTEDQDVKFSVQDGVLRVDLLSGPLPGVVIRKFAADWRGYRSLAIEVENPTAVSLPLEVHVRDRGSTDERSDRFTAQVMLEPGQRSMLRFALTDIEAAPEGRRMRMESLLVVAVYRVGSGSDQFTLHAIRLE